jgi:hypothetical protein
MRLAPLLAFAVVCSHCTVVQRPTPIVAEAYDCRLVAGPFAVAHEAGPAAKAFGQQPDGILLVEQYFNSSALNETRFLNLTTHVLTVSGRQGVSQQPLGAVRAEQVDSVCRRLERGAFRQACVSGPSEGSRTLLLVKAHGDTVLQYEAPQYDYRHLNPHERAKLPRALNLIALIGQHIE